MTENEAFHTMPEVGPVRAEERISSLDTIRGFALLGILLMNIVGFGLHAAYDDPTNSGGATGANLWAWIIMHVLAEGKMRCLFSMVFGAGVVLLTARAEQRGAGVSTADVFYRRNLWLFVFGLAHAYLLWHGEVLYPYALCALVLFAFRNASARRLFAIGPRGRADGDDQGRRIPLADQLAGSDRPDCAEQLRAALGDLFDDFLRIRVCDVRADGEASALWRSRRDLCGADDCEPDLAEAFPLRA